MCVSDCVGEGGRGSEMDEPCLEMSVCVVLNTFYV